MNPLFLATLLSLSITVLHASNAVSEVPLGTAIAVVEQTYGKPDPHPVYTIIGKTPTKEELDNAFIYSRLVPPRFYKFRKDQIDAIHYFNLTGKDMGFVRHLLSLNAKNQEINEIDPKTLGHDPTGLGIARAWRCPSMKWIALYRVYKDTNPSLYIYTDDLKK